MRPVTTPTALRDDQRRLIREIEVLQRCERRTGLLAKPIIDQLVRESERGLPDRLPVKPEWVEFQWPNPAYLDFNEEWRDFDHRQWLQSRSRANK